MTNLVDKAGMFLAEKKNTNTIAFVTLGCAKNEADSNGMRALARSAGLIEVPNPADADFVLINTCAFITAATEESLDVILEASELDNVKSGKTKLVVSGCLPSRYGAELETELPEVAAFVDVSNEAKIKEVLLGLGHFAKSSDNIAEILPTPNQPWAYVKISDGCSRKCSFCTIPAIRGPYHSYSYQQINSQVSSLVSQGIKEIILIGQDTGIWGADLLVKMLKESSAPQPSQKTVLADNSQRNAGDPSSLADLLEILATTYPQTWFRIMYLQPQGVTSQLLETISRHVNICNYLDIPLQHASVRVLGQMHRSGSGPKYLDLLDKIRTAIPDMALRTTMIAGFPGETQRDAKESEQFLEAAQFDFAGVFCYSQEDGTVAGQRHDQVPVRTRQARAQRLRDIADSVGFERAETLLNTQQQVLIVGEDEDGLYGRTQGQAPEVDGVVYLTGPDVDKLLIGDIVNVKIVDAICYDLYAEPMMPD